MTAGFTGNITFKMSDGASPEVYSLVEEAKSVSGVGQVNPLIDATSFDSTAKEYIAGLPDGTEITVECVRVHTASNIQDTLRTNVINKATQNFQLAITDGSVSPNLTDTLTFAGVCLSWAVTPSNEDVNMISFSIKISGSITIT